MQRLPFEVKALLEKAREAANLAVETYNRPTATFRSGAFTVLTIIAWTALFHAIFLKKKTKPIFRKKNSRRFERVDGEPKRWDLTECLRRHFGSQQTPIRSNLEFLIRLRNRIEHHSLGRLDPELFGECQAAVLNFDYTIVEHFGERNAIRGGLTWALQFGPGNQRPLKPTERKGYKEVKAFVDAFRANLGAEINGSLQYSFRVYLVPKIANHQAKDTAAIEFVKYDPQKPEDMQKYERLVAMIKPRDVAVSNAGMLKPSQVAVRVAERLGRRFTLFDHQLCYQHFQVRPPARTPDAAACNTQFCIYDVVHKDYCYTQAWVDFLASKLSEPATYQAIMSKKKSSKTSASQPVLSATA